MEELLVKLLTFAVSRDTGRASQLPLRYGALALEAACVSEGSPFDMPYSTSSLDIPQEMLL